MRNHEINSCAREHGVFILAELFYIKFIELESERLIYRKFNENDFAVVFDWINNAENMKYREEPLNESQAHDYLNWLISEQDNIKAIGFSGSEQPIEKLMWFLVYRFTEYALKKVVWDENRYPLPECPIMPDGGQYFPLGFDPAVPEKRYDFSDVPNWNEKYERITSWDCNGTMTDVSDNYTLRWYGLYTAGNHTIEQLFRKHSSKNYNTSQLLFKTLERDFDISRLNAEEKEILSEIINNRWVSKNDDKIIPNFSVFTKAQAQSLTSIFEEMYNGLKSVIYGIFAKIEKLCRADLPKHLESYLNYHIYMTFYDALKITTGFAYYDGKIHDPKDEIECGLLTFHAIKNTDE